MRGRLARPGLALLLALLIVLGMAPPTAAQETVSGVRLVSPYLGVAVEPGDTASFDLKVIAEPGESVDLAIEDLPDGWAGRIRGGGFQVERILFDDELSIDLELEVDVPQDTPEGGYQVAVVARGEASTAQLKFELNVAQAVGGGVSLNAEFPALRGPSDVTFTFTLELSNETSEGVQFGLQAQGPAGWQIDVRPAGESRAASLNVDAGSSERLTVEVDPPDTASAGQYGVLVQAAGGGDTAAAELFVDITGNFDVMLTTPDQRLNVDVEAGRPTELPLVVVNNGTAPLTEVSLTATPPRGWDVSFVPESISQVEPGGTIEVTATVTPSSDAITGDYRMTLTSSVPEASDSIEIRATVETSAIWGLVGVAIILVALTTLVLVFRRFGRR